jgi:class 3 adenylate cyclase
MKMTFKYKLAGSISLILIGVLAGVYIFLQADIEEDALVSIKARLTSTRKSVSELIQARRHSLVALATGVVQSEALNDILKNPRIDAGTGDEIVVRRLLPSYPRLSLLSVIGADGKVLGGNPAGHRLRASLIRSQAFRTALGGQPGECVVFDHRQCIQIAAFPVRGHTQSPGPPEDVVLVGMNWLKSDLDRLQQLSGVQIALFHQGIAVLSTGPPFGNRPALDDHDTSRPRTVWQIATRTPTLVRIDNKRFLLLKGPDDHGRSPAFVIARALDAELSFVDLIFEHLIWFGLVGVCAGIGVSFLFSLGVSRPLRRLMAATEKIEAGDYDHQVPVIGRDEFSHLSLAFNRMVEGLRERDYIRNTFGRYIDPEVARELLRRPETAEMGGKKREVAIVMADIRGFTAICEALSPAETLSWLNAYFSAMIKVIIKHRGIIIDFVGDAILFYVDPLEEDLTEAAGRAVRCAFDMQRQTAVLNAEIRSTPLPAVETGIGISAGPVIVGNIGSKDRVKYGIVGSPVNIAQRIQEQAGPGEIVVSSALLARARSDLKVLRRFNAHIKGFREPISLYAIAPVEKAANLKSIV